MHKSRSIRAKHTHTQARHKTSMHINIQSINRVTRSSSLVIRMICMDTYSRRAMISLYFAPIGQPYTLYTFHFARRMILETYTLTIRTDAQEEKKQKTNAIVIISA